MAEEELEMGEGRGIERGGPEGAWRGRFIHIFRAGGGGVDSHTLGEGQ